MESDPIPLSIFVLALATVGAMIAAQGSFSQVGRADLRKLGEDGNGRAKDADQLLQDSERLRLTLMLVKTAGVLSAGGALARLLPDSMGPVALGAILGLVWLGLVLAQAAGRNWVHARALPITLALTPVVRAAMLLLWPFTALIQRLSVDETTEKCDDANGHVVLSEEELRRLIGVREAEQPMQATEMQMIASILEMEETVAREVMVPRIDMVTLNVESTLTQSLSTIIEAGHSRIPVYEEDTDHVVGFLYAKDLLACFQENRTEVPIRSLLRPAYFVPASKKVNMLLREMQRDRVHIAMVVDEYGGIAGLVTIEDIIEEIVGEIQDEYDVEEETYVQVLEPNIYLLNGRLDLYSLAKLLDIELEDDDADTLGGLIYSGLGHVPVPGETLEVDGWRFTVLSLEGRRIEEVRAEPIEQLLVDFSEVLDENTASNGASNKGAGVTRRVESSAFESASKSTFYNYSASD